MNQYILLLHDPADGTDTMSPEEMQATIQKYSNWAKSLGEQGKYVSGEKLADDGGRILQTVNSEMIVSDAPYSETKDVTGGYFIIRADNYDAAEAIARTCPHAELGSAIEIRHLEFAEG